MMSSHDVAARRCYLCPYRSKPIRLKDQYLACVDPRRAHYALPLDDRCVELDQLDQVDLLAIERAHRIGQAKPVKVYRLVCSGSVEERMVSMVSERRGMKETRELKEHKANMVSTSWPPQPVECCDAW